MKTEEQNQAIAESLGWHSEPSQNPDFKIVWKRGEQYRFALPQYSSSLDAMHEAEKTLTDDQRGRVMDYLCEIVRRDHNPAAGPMTAIITAFFSTAAQRSEAFLRTLSLWKE